MPFIFYEGEEVRALQIDLAKVRPIVRHTGCLAAFPSEHLLFAVQNGAGKLRIAGCENTREILPDTEFCGALLLGDTPLVEVQSSGCPTCESLLAAGYGLPESSPVLLQIREAMTRPYAGLEEALARLRPLLGLLPTGLYVLSHSAYFPTDGVGRFFWNAPDRMTAYPATAELYESGCYRGFPCFPCFLYPSQPVRKYDATRVEEYRRQIREGRPLPPALVYALWGYLGVLLDGHHRACACALEGKSVPCLTIANPGRIWRKGVPHLVWPDEAETAEEELPPKWRALLDRPARYSTVKLPPRSEPDGALSRGWPREYANAARQYPDFREAATLACYPKIELTREGLDFLICDEDYEDVAGAARLLTYAARRLGAEAKPLLLSYAAADNCKEMRRAALAALCRIKNDPEIEELMIRILVDCERRDDPLYRIADGYWGE